MKTCGQQRVKKINTKSESTLVKETPPLQVQGFVLKGVEYALTFFDVVVWVVGIFLPHLSITIKKKVKTTLLCIIIKDILCHVLEK